jgi:putative DNA primase/helicase
VQDGRKIFLTGGRKRGCYFAIGRPADVLCVCEGYATAASIFEATEYATAVAFDAGNLEPVALALRAKFPDTRIVICADNDIHTSGNPGLTAATRAAAAVCGAVACPHFKRQ